MTAALGLVEARGLDGLTIKLVADELDYAVGALYRYFPSKSALIAELQRETVERLDGLHADCVARCAELTKGEPATAAWASLAPVVATVSLYSAYSHFSPGSFGLLALSLGDPRHLIDDEQARAVLETAEPIFERIGASLEQAAVSHALSAGDGVDRAILLWASLHGVVQLDKLARVGSERIDTERLAARLCEALLCGWGAEPEAIRQAQAHVSDAGVVESVLNETE